VDAPNVANTLFQTAMYLAPMDLLNLSRISKQFRSIFASRSSIFVWKTAFFNVDVKCYEDLNEIQFARFLYDKSCMVTFSLFFCTTVDFFYAPLRHADV
jgi:hypothetical protein